MHLIFINYLLIFNILYLCIDDYLKKYPPLDTSSAPLNQLSVISYQLSAVWWGMRSPPPTHKGALGGGRATTRI
jgi:hypothetical protein